MSPDKRASGPASPSKAPRSDRTPNRRAEQKERTRALLLESTIEVVAGEGLSGTTLGKVARKAGLSQGIVNFHFESKEQLLHRVLELLTEEYRDGWRAALAGGGSPGERMGRVVTALLAPEITERRRLAAWFAYWGDAYARNIYRQIGSRVDEETAVALEDLCEQMATLADPRPPEPVTEITDTLVAMISGHWLTKVLRPESTDMSRSADMCLNYLRRVFPGQISAVDGVEPPVG